MKDYSRFNDVEYSKKFYKMMNEKVGIWWEQDWENEEEFAYNIIGNLEEIPSEFIDFLEYQKKCEQASVDLLN